MNENIDQNVVTSSVADFSVDKAIRPRAFETIVYGGLAIGVLDALDATIFYGLKNGVSPIGIFQSISSGLLGRAAYDGGLATVLLGAFLHFLIAFTIATVYYAASLRFQMLIRQAILCGVIYGIAVYFVMNQLVVPLSAAPKFKLTPASFLNGVIGHALLVGLPVALIARWSVKINKSRTGF